MGNKGRHEYLREPGLDSREFPPPLVIGLPEDALPCCMAPASAAAAAAQASSRMVAANAPQWCGGG